jgi:hypothetical protein
MMHEKLMKMLEKKKAKKLSPMEKKAKMGVLGELKDDMSSEMGGSLKDMMAKKVSVMAGNKKDLEKGLDKAKEMVEKMPGDGHLEDMEAEESEGSPAEEAAESVEEETSELAHGEEDVDSEIKMLEKKLAMLKAKKGQEDESEEE